MGDSEQVVPEGWEVQTLEALAQPKGIAYGVLKPGPRSAVGVPMLRVSDVRDGEIDTSNIYKISPELDAEFRRTKLRGGEIVVSIQGSVGRVAVVPSDLAGANVSRTLAMIRLRDPTLAPWIHRALEAPTSQQAMRAVIGGTTRDSLNLRDLRRIELLIAPEPQRTSTIQLINDSLTKISSSSLHLNDARRAIRRFRQAVLSAGCSGRLTQSWRDAGGSEQSAKGLIQDIEISRREKLGNKFKSSAAPEVDQELPEGWVWSTVGALVDVGTGATPLRSRSDYYGGSVPWVTSGAVNAGSITEANEYISELALTETNAKVFPVGTLLIAMYGEGQTRGRVGELRISAATNQAVAALLFDETSEGLRDYLRIFFLENYERIRQLSFGGVQPNLSLDVIRRMTIPVPPLEEQREIVRRVDQLLADAEGISSRIDSASRRVVSSSQAVLAKAFRGELIGALNDTGTVRSA